MKTRRLAVIAGGACAMLLPMLAGCKLIAAPFLMWGDEPTQKVPAKYPYLDGKKICIVVWAEQATLFEYPNVRFELSEWVSSELSNALRGATVVPNRSIVELQNREPDWERMNPGEIGKRFGADRVLAIELTQYTTREPDSPHLYRGHISANIKVFDCAQPDAGPTYRTQVATAYPLNSMSEWGSDDRGIRRDTMAQFAIDVVNLFHDRVEKVKK